MTYEDAMHALEYARKNDTELENDTLISMLNVSDFAMYGDNDISRNAGVQIKRLVWEVQRLQRGNKPVHGLGYQMALDDIGEIGEALGLNPSTYMTHSPLQVANMVLRRAKELAAELRTATADRDRASTINQQMVLADVDTRNELVNDRVNWMQETTAHIVRRVVADRDQWKRRAEAQLEITRAAIAMVTAPYELYEIRGWTGSYLISRKEFGALQGAVEEYKKLAEQEAAAAPTPSL